VRFVVSLAAFSTLTGITTRWHRPFPDPAKVEGSQKEKLSKVREIRDQIKDWLQNPGGGDLI
jgi:arsenate reductase